jgi:hypothetical protein
MARLGQKEVPLVGQLNNPLMVRGRYVIKKCDPPVLIRHLSQTRNAGFATEWTILLQQIKRGTLIMAEAYVVGKLEMVGGGADFLKGFTAPVVQRVGWLASATTKLYLSPNLMRMRNDCDRFFS